MLCFFRAIRYLQGGVNNPRLINCNSIATVGSVMKASRKRTKKGDWPKRVSLGRVSVSVYRRKLTNGRYGFQLANYASGKRRLDSYPTEGKAIEAAHRLARQLSEQQVVAASLTNAQAADYAAASQAPGFSVATQLP